MSIYLGFKWTRPIQDVYTTDGKRLIRTRDKSRVEQEEYRPGEEFPNILLDFIEIENGKDVVEFANIYGTLFKGPVGKGAQKDIEYWIGQATLLRNSMWEYSTQRGEYLFASEVAMKLGEYCKIAFRYVLPQGQQEPIYIRKIEARHLLGFLWLIFSHILIRKMDVFFCRGCRQWQLSVEDGGSVCGVCLEEEEESVR